MKKPINIQDKKKEYESVCNEFVKCFCKKQKIEFDGWIADEVGGIAGFCWQYFFSMQDIILDLTTNQPRGNILDWQSADVDFNILKETGEEQHINYKSYTIGLRHGKLKAIVNKKSST